MFFNYDNEIDGVVKTARQKNYSKIIAKSGNVQDQKVNGNNPFPVRKIALDKIVKNETLSVAQIKEKN